MTSILIFQAVIFKMEYWKYPIYAGLFFICIVICDLISIQVYSFLYPQATLDYLNNFHALRYNAALISKLLAFICLLIISLKEGKEEVPFLKGNLYVLGITFIMSFIGLFAIDGLIRLSLGNMKDGRADLLTCILSISIFSANMIVYWVIKQLNSNIQKQKEYTLIQYQNELLIKSAEENKALENEWRKIRHDFNNHISCIDMLLQMGNVEKARHYIQNLTQNLQPKELNVHIGNEIADAVLNQKILRAKSNQIAVEIKGELAESLAMADMDLCALLSNSLDNAIEAACQIENSEYRKIEMIISQGVKHVYIMIRNNVRENINTSGWITTTKKDTKRHGIGMRSMKTAVEKYNGELNWQCEDQVFTLNIMLPL